jgi:hypothetical protein
MRTGVKPHESEGFSDKEGADAARGSGASSIASSNAAVSLAFPAIVRAGSLSHAKAPSSRDLPTRDEDGEM